MQKYSLKGFSLPELIVVITIIAILSTIGFVSYTWYLNSSRDSARVQEITEIHNALQSYAVKNRLPLPDDKVEIKLGGNIWGIQWYAWTSVLSTIWYRNGGKDPSDKSYYTYYITPNRKYAQLLAYLEGAEYLSQNNFISPKVHADSIDYSSRFPKLYGSPLWILLNSSSKAPLQNDITNGSFSLSSSTSYHAYLSDWNIRTDLAAALPYASCNRIRDIGASTGPGDYQIITSSQIERVPCKMDGTD